MRQPSEEGQEVWGRLSADYKEELSEFFQEPDQKVLLSMFTCANCKIVKSCTLAYDSYNTDDDCLADK